MNRPAMIRQPVVRAPIWLVPCLALIVALAFVSNDSFWIDEGNSAFKAVQPTFRQWWRTLVSVGGSDAQMPGYMFYVWAWEKVFGTSEHALRASNIPWLMVTVVFLRRVPYLWLVLLTSPFILYYTNELRPYLMQVGSFAMILSSLMPNPRGKACNIRVFLAGSFLLCASSLTGVLWSAGSLYYLLAGNPALLRDRVFWRNLAVAAPFFLILGGYYLKSLLDGQGASAMGGGVLLSIAACGYELSGLMGLGPGRIELREHPGSVVRYLIPLAIGIAVFASAAIAGSAAFIMAGPRRRLIHLCIAAAIPLGALLTLVIVKDFRLLARHLAPLAVLLALPVAALLAAAPGSRFSRPLRILGVLAVILGIASSLSLRLAPRHKKDDFRTAAAIARRALADGSPVWWAADAPTASYYGLNAGTRNLAFYTAGNPMAEPQPGSVVIMSKPDIVDRDGELRKFLEKHRFQKTATLQAFTVWKLEANP